MSAKILLIFIILFIMSRLTFSLRQRMFVCFNQNIRLPSNIKLPRQLSYLSGIKGDMISENIKIDQESYLFGRNSAQFSELKLHSDIIQALRHIGFNQATSIQSKAIPTILSGSDVVIGAETGSGKTLAYLVPVIDSVMRSQHKRDKLTDDESSETNSDVDSIKYPQAVVLLPNRDLCNQVLEVAHRLITNTEIPISIDFPPPADSMEPYPDIVVTTPTFFNRFAQGTTVHVPEIFKSIKQLVLDEADMLLEGSYLKDIETIVDAFKIVRRTMIHDGLISINAPIVQYILSAATIPSYGLKSIDKYISQRYPNAVKITQEYFHEHHPRIKQTFIKVPSESVCSKYRVDLLIKAIQEFKYPLTESQPNESLSESISLETMVSESFQTPTIPSTMIFVNTAQSARDLAYFLHNQNIPCVEYHKLINDDERRTNLNNFREGLIPIIICTDSAARGLDLPNVRHVIQAEFALNIVQHLHRIGRASRAGAIGYATNFYDDLSWKIVKLILPQRNKSINQHFSSDEPSLEASLDTKNEQENRTIQHAFSRRRGLRQKEKKLERKLNSNDHDSKDGRDDEILRDIKNLMSDTHSTESNEIPHQQNKKKSVFMKDRRMTTINPLKSQSNSSNRPDVEFNRSDYE